ncbi:unnamed protein product, partial [Mesorhabditis spiculigera]
MSTSRLDVPGEKEQLLPPEGELRKSSSSRFQVSPAAESDEEDTRRVKSVSEPPQPSETLERKTSVSTGRFTVNGTDETAEEEPHDEHDETLDSAEPVGRRNVHFNVGGGAAGEEERKTTDTVHEGQHTLNQKSWRNIATLEHPPIIDFYRDSIDAVDVNRPSMAQLIHGHGEQPIHEESLEIDQFKEEALHVLDQHPPIDEPGREEDKEKIEKLKAPDQGAGRKKFGWIEGVFVRCLLSIFGVILYLRISWVTGQAGIVLGILIVLLSTLVTVITAISTCAICTNGEVKGGGAYFLISRSLGPEYGGAIGLIFTLANGVGSAMYMVGLAETIRDLLAEHALTSPPVQEFLDMLSELNFIRIVAMLFLLTMVAVIFIGTSFESKIQMGLLVLLLASIVDYFAGALILEPTMHTKVRGATALSMRTFLANLTPQFGEKENFFTVFAIYFPAATGIMAGANISGDLANPQKAIPLGTLLAILATTIVYIFIVIFTGSTNVRHADGILEPMWDAVGFFVPPNCTIEEGGCKYGLLNFYQVIEMQALFGPLITAGIFAATLSSALGSLVAAPKIFQAVCKDRLFPGIDYFGKGFGRDEEPRRAYALVAVLALLVILVGDLNAIAPIISNFFLASYAILNYACFDQSFADSPGFRPGFKYYNKWVSLAGSILCVVVMFIVSWITALLTFFFFALIFIYLWHRKPDVNWGSSTQAHSYRNALAGMVKLANTEEHVKNYRPQLLVLTGNPASRPSLVDFVGNITKGNSLMVCGYVVPYAPTDRVLSVLRKLDRQLTDWLRKKKTKSFYTSIADPSMRQGVRALYQTAGLGKLRPNIVILGYKGNWVDKEPTEKMIGEMSEYFGIIQDAFDYRMGVGVLRNCNNSGLDFSENLRILNGHHDGKKKEAIGPVKDSNPQVNSGRSDASFDILKEKDKLADIEKGRLSDNEEKAADEDDALSTVPQMAPSRSARSMETFMREGMKVAEATGSFAENFPFDFDLDDSEADSEGEYLDAEDEKPQTTEECERIPLKEQKTNMSIRRRGRPKISMAQLKKISLAPEESLSRRTTVEQKALLTSMSRFSKKIREGTIDVWWLYDDGGLSLLIPHLLTIPKSYLEGAKLRVFSISTSRHTMEAEQRGLVALLTKFRIDFSNVSVMSDIGKKPKPETRKTWENLIAPYTVAEGEEREGDGWTSPSELQAQRDKTFRQLRIGELLQENSMGADLIVITLPVPRKGMVSPSLYLSWLEMMTRGLPPTLLLRGNQQSVLTFYS